jgi:hypothetical protein
LGESERGARDAVFSPVPMDAGRTSALLLARTGCRGVVARHLVVVLTT